MAGLFHVHRWQVVDVSCGSFVVLGGDGTAVLYRCACGLNTTKTLNGRWTAEQLGAKGEVQ